MMRRIGFGFSTKKSGPLMAMKTTYTSRHVDLPPTFLTSAPKEPVTCSRIDFENSEVPEFKDHKAAVISNVLSLEECDQLLRLAESSFEPGKDDTEPGPWRPALLNMGPGWEVYDNRVRHSDRIVWDQQELANRIWARCLLADGVAELVSTTPDDYMSVDGKWVFDCPNPRLRFLKYTKGQFFKGHCDGTFRDAKDGKEVKTFYTIQLYLDNLEPSEELVGGATSFLSRDEKRRIAVAPLPGSVLLFQQKSLYHEGSVVEKGTKYTMRTDLQYVFEKDETDGTTEEQATGTGGAGA